MTDAAQELLARLAPLLEDLRTAALVDEVEGTRPHAQVRRLAEAGFGALRLPKEEGGGGVDLVTFFTVLVQVAAADSNQAQIWRNHIAFVEDRLQPQPRERNQHWRAVLAGGAVIGGPWTEPGPASFAPARTRLEPAPDGHGWRLTGTKYYSTGSFYADWISVTARRPTSPSGGSQEGTAARTGDSGAQAASAT